jgi:cell division protein FtsB
MNRQKNDIAMLQDTAKETRLKQVEVESERSALQYELSIADTPDYIAEKARTLYGYLLPGEIRFKVTNPEALYGEEPSARVVEEGK